MAPFTYHSIDNDDSCNYNVIMEARVIKIGNSQGIRIPKIVLEQVRIQEDDNIQMNVAGDQIIISRKRKLREGWEDAFRLMASAGEDQLIDRNRTIHSSWDEEEWQW